MKDNITTGKIGEELACNYLLEKGYIILERNWRFSKAEIDIIAKLEEMLIFVEVKTRSYDYYGSPESFLSERQESLLADAANEYMKQVGYEWEFRFDVIGILLRTQTDFELSHIEDAFFSGI